MKLSELCEVMGLTIEVHYKNENNSESSFWVSGDSSQEKIHQCEKHANWDIIGLSHDPANYLYAIAEIAKPEDADEQV